MSNDPWPDDQHVKAIVRIRPLNELELSSKQWSRSVLHVNPTQSSGYQLSIRNPSFDDSESHSKASIDSYSLRNYVFDTVHGPESTQLQVFDSVMYIIDCVTMGYHGTIFAYGQTGTGKTHTLFGTQYGNKTHGGITQLSLRHLFHKMNTLDSTALTDNDLPKSHTTYTVSFIEIYHDKVYDLLVTSSADSKSLSVREGRDNGVYVQGNKQIQVQSSEEAEKILQTGIANRHINETRANRYSSRSHAIYTIKVERTKYVNNLKVLTQAKLTIVDLAGSERQRTADVQGNILKEASSINKSLLFLGKLIDNLAMKNTKNRNNQDRMISYRDCKLTFLLRDSLGGNAKTCLIATVSPSASSISETISTLNFLQKAKLIENNANINTKPVETVADLQQEITLLRKQVAQLQALNVDSTMENMDEQIFSPSNKRLQEEVTRLRLQVKQLQALDTEWLTHTSDDQPLVSPGKATPKASGSGRSSDTFLSDESLPSIETAELLSNAIHSESENQTPLLHVQPDHPPLESMITLIPSLPMVIHNDLEPRMVNQNDSKVVRSPLQNVSSIESASTQLDLGKISLVSSGPYMLTPTCMAKPAMKYIESREPPNEFTSTGLELIERDSNDDLTQSLGDIHDMNQMTMSGIFRVNHPIPRQIPAHSIDHNYYPPWVDQESSLHVQLHDMEESNKKEKDQFTATIQKLTSELESQRKLALESMDNLKRADMSIDQLKEELKQAREEIRLQKMKEDEKDKNAKILLESMLQDQSRRNSDDQMHLKQRISTLEFEVQKQEKSANEAYQRAIAAEEYISILKEEIRTIQDASMRDLEVASTNINYLQNALNVQAMDVTNVMEKATQLDYEKEAFRVRVLEAEERLRTQRNLDRIDAKKAILNFEDIIENKLSELKRVSTSHGHSSRNKGIFRKLIFELENDLDEFHARNFNEDFDERRSHRGSHRWHDDYDSQPVRPSLGCGCFDLMF